MLCSQAIAPHRKANRAALAPTSFLGMRVQSAITVGWTAASALTELPTPPPISPPVTRDHDTAQLAKNDHTERYRFQLAEGRGIPVCDAYLQRLNETEYWGPPYCGRPEDSRVPGFSRLHRVYLTGAETAQLYPHLQSFGNARSE